MKERGIIMTGHSVQGILDGRKTVTRRIVKGAALEWLAPGMFDPSFVASRGNSALCPYGQPGDRLWVREAWRVPTILDGLSGKQIAEKCLDAGYRKPWCPIQYEADGSRNSEKDWREFGEPGRYRHARFMPRWASRITLEVTGVRVERLQDISYEDALREGIHKIGIQADECGPNRVGYSAWEGEGPSLKVTTTEAFHELWESINGPGSWDTNPWVWVIEFKRVTP